MLETNEEMDSAPRGDRVSDEEVTAPDRSTYIGGGDIAALLGSNPYKSALDVYGRKIGVVPEPPENEAMEWGNRLEPTIAQKYADREGVRLIKGQWMRGPKPYLGGTPDYLVEGIRRGLECKSFGLVSWHPELMLWGEDGSDEVPEHYAIQCHWYMAITGFSRWDVAAFIAGRGFAVFHLKRDPELCAALLGVADRFMTEHVFPRIPPEPDGSESAREAIKALWPKNTKPLIQATPEIHDLAMEYRAACDAFDEAEAVKSALENRIKALIADADGVEGAGWSITYKQPKPSIKVDMKALEADPDAAPLLAKHRRSVENARRIHKNWNTNPKGK